MAAVELDPLFVKALKLLHSRSKDSSDQLKQMLDEAIEKKRKEICLKKGEDYVDPKDTKSAVSTKTSSRKEYASESTKSRDSEKRSFDKIQKDIIELDPVPPKKCKLEPPSPPVTEYKSEREKEKTRENKDKVKDRQREERVREREKIKEKPEKKVVERRRSDSESSQTESEDEGKGSMAIDDFAFDEGLACVVCRNFDVSSGNQLVECQECHNLYHQDCHRPPVTEKNVSDPRFVWYCSKCSKTLKKMASKTNKGKSGNVPPLSISSRDIFSSKVAKVETAILQPFKRVDATKTSLSKENGGSSRPFSGLSGLASLAANLSGKSTDSKHGGSKGDSNKSSSSGKSDSSKISSTSSKLSSSGRSDSSSKSLSSPLGSLFKPDPVKVSKSNSSKTSSISGLGRQQSGSSTSSSASKSSSVTSQSSKSGGSISSSSAFSRALSLGTSTSSKGNSGSSSTSSSKTSSSSSSGKSSSSGMAKVWQSSLMSADKRLQMMKKKAAAKMQEKRLH